MRVPLTSIAASLVALFLLVVPAVAAPGPDTSPVRLWSVSKVVQGAGELPVADGAQVGGELFQRVAIGAPVAFNLPFPSPYWENLPRDDAYGALFSSSDGKHYSVLTQAPSFNPRRVGGVKGSVTHLDEYQAYVKRAGDASLRITISGILLQAIDDNNSRLGAWECPPEAKCEPVRTVVRVHARAYAASAGGDFFDAGGVAYLEGHQHSWRPGAATSADSPGPLWGEEQFDVDGDRDGSNTGASAGMSLKKPRSLKVPLGSIRTGELFAVHVSLEAEAVDDRGGESAAQAAIQDPQQLEANLLVTHGLAPRGKPRFAEPRVKPLAPARCPSGRPAHSGALQFSDAGFTVDESQREPSVLVTRSGGSRGSASVTFTTHGGSAQAGRDFKSVTTTVRFAAGDTSPRLVEIPMREDGEVEPAESFTVELGHARCAALGARRHATVTIVDDDQVSLPPAPQPEPVPPTFTVGGTIDGLQGAGLALSDLGGELVVSGNGPFTLPGTRTSGQPYEIAVKTQPHDPDQVCTIHHGAGTVGSANVADVVVHCETLATPSGLDGTFGSDGRVSTPVGAGHGEAVVTQPGGKIVTAGWRTTPPGNDFVLTRHDSAGNLDTGFGKSGIVTTDVGGADDEAFDAALLADGGIVVVGRTDAAGVQKTAFAVVRYRPDGTLDSGFGTGGIVRTGIFGKGAQANAVAVQPDGKIVVAGLAISASGIDSDFAVVRYNADGTLDTSFGMGGVVTTNLGTLGDDGRAVVIQPDGRIVVAGSADEDIALVRYLPDGALDGTFGRGGSTITDLGSDDVANGVALTPTGEIVIAGFTLGAKVNRDFLLARYRADGSLDTAFGDHGTVKTDVGGGDDFAENLAVDAAGRIVLVGRATSSTILDLALVRYQPDGNLDTSFDGDGILTADFHGRGEFGQDVAFDTGGRIVAAGYTANGPDTEFALLRANP